eukprot:CAMPEP_0119495872 /NCGR_PEP_ID=MMETSP1344-20130328/19376_1 /TAXON_ID=236787 /ORGANISM="Florenciella parvula, Strain CCMP2471" /LENGTH=150 /DNA_ID=CAMNT_0007531503 /DNA_START=1 /DNA_END=449 /DNA_ORIENTATION=-
MAAETLTGDQLAACEKLVKHGGNNSDAVAAFVAVVPIESLFLALNAAATRRNELSRMLQSATAAVFSPPHGAGYAFEAEVVPFLVAGIGHPTTELRVKTLEILSKLASAGAGPQICSETLLLDAIVARLADSDGSVATKAADTLLVVATS